MDYFKPYEGEKPYFFVSYSHRNSETVLEVLQNLRRRSFRLWYDEGIPAGSDWPQNIRQHMADCGVVLFFQSETALTSPNCLNEIRAAYAAGKRIYRIRLDDSRPNSIWEAVLKKTVDVTAEEFPERKEIVTAFLGTEEDYAHGKTAKAKLQVLDVVLAVMALTAAVAAAAGFAAKLLDESRVPAHPVVITEPVYVEKPSVTDELGQWREAFQNYAEFPDSLQESAMRDAIRTHDVDVVSTDLIEVQELYFCGGKYMSSLADVSYDGASGWKLDGAAVPEGIITNLSLIGKLPKLEKLALINQPLSDFSALKGTVNLRELSLAGCVDADISTLPQLPSLEKLSLEHTSVRDLTPLRGRSGLRVVTVSADMFPMTLDTQAQYDVVLVK